MTTNTNANANATTKRTICRTCDQAPYQECSCILAAKAAKAAQAANAAPSLPAPFTLPSALAFLGTQAITPSQARALAAKHQAPTRDALVCQGDWGMDWYQAEELAAKALGTPLRY